MVNEKCLPFERQEAEARKGWRQKYILQRHIPVTKRA